MLNSNFYDKLDVELGDIIEKYKNDDVLKKHSNSIDNQKTYAFLIWFLEFYGKTSNYVDYITEGKGDASCNIVFDQEDQFGKRVFYIIQSKWNNKKNIEGNIDSKHIKYSLQDFDTIIRGGKDVENVNSALQEKLPQLQEHIAANGELKIIFLSLCSKSDEVLDNIKSFEQQHKLTKVEYFDIEKLKLDYIDKHYKKIQPLSPIQTHYDPQKEKITLHVEKEQNINSQNPVLDRDFKANDEVQVRLQKEFFAKNIWYEKRRDEFREILDGVHKVSNKEFATVYLAYHLEEPTKLVSEFFKDSSNDLLFLSHKEHPDGLYEKIFNENSKVEDFEVSLKVCSLIMASFREITSDDIPYLTVSIFAPLVKIILQKYIVISKYPKLSVSQFIANLTRDDLVMLLVKIIYLIQEGIINKKVKSIGEFVINPNQYQRIKGEVEELEITAEQIDNIDIEEVQKLLDND